jgi:L-asparaginase II
MSEVLVEMWRGSFLECQHRGHAVIVNSRGDILESWGNPSKEILPRSACKILQAVPLVESGAADAYGLNLEHLALSCASHQGDSLHTQAESTRGTKTKDTFSLRGFTAALKDAKKRCGV